VVERQRPALVKLASAAGHRPRLSYASSFWPNTAAVRSAVTPWATPTPHARWLRSA